ncbi:MAG: hypothetical protein EPO64_01730 [Nitrospirae bacterium]|nr:MAG: hypothetical protein EPO64_01730 [Nitrospirota bacterium]
MADGSKRNEAREQSLGVCFPRQAVRIQQKWSIAPFSSLPFHFREDYPVGQGMKTVPTLEMPK